MLIPILTACGAVQTPELEVGSKQVLLDSYSPVNEITIANQGAPRSLLSWQASSDSPLVHVSPSHGQVRGGGPAQTVRISIDFSGLGEGVVTEAVVSVSSNGGQFTLPVRFMMNSTRPCVSTDVEQTSDGQSAYGTLAAPEAGNSAAGDFEAGEFVAGELLVGYRLTAEAEIGNAGGETFTSTSAIAADQGFRALSAGVRDDHRLTLLSAAGAAGFERVAAKDPLAAAERLKRDPRVSFAHPNYYVRPAALPNDPCFFEQWPLQGYGVPEAWESSGSNRVVVAVIDTGVDIDHEDLYTKVLPGYDFWDNDSDPRPGGPTSAAAHGTHVAGIALAQGNNGVGVAGVAHQSHVLLLPVKIFDDSGILATTAGLADAILWAAGISVRGVPANPYPADVINISLGAGPHRIAAIDRAVDRARRAGSVLLAAAGNNLSTDGAHGVQSPANSPGVIAVGSVDENNARSAFSDWGEADETVDLMAPGGYGGSSCRRIRSTVPWSNYSCMAGTSMAAPFAAGVAALVLTREPGLAPEDLELRLRQATYFDSASMNHAEYGQGVLCADRAVAGTGPFRSRPCGSP